jgi:hypothetical protein
MVAYLYSLSLAFVSINISSYRTISEMYIMVMYSNER